MKDHWIDFTKEPVSDTLNPIIIYTKYEEMAIVKWLVDGWDGPHWYSADQEHYYTEDTIMYWMNAPKQPEKK